MIIGRGENKDKAETVLVLGLSRENINRLVAGQPIWLTRRSHGDAMPDGLDIRIIFGETEKKLYDALKAGGAINESTPVFRDRRMNDR